MKNRKIIMMAVATLGMAAVLFSAASTSSSEGGASVSSISQSTATVQPTPLPTPQSTLPPLPTREIPTELLELVPLTEEDYDYSVPDFLNEEQQNLYRCARKWFGIYRYLTAIIDEKFPNEDGTRLWDYSPNPYYDFLVYLDSCESPYWPVVGYYADWAMFDAAFHRLFTDDFVAWLNNTNLHFDPPREGERLHFLEIDGRTYYLSYERGGDPEYVGDVDGSISPDRYIPDTYRLIEKTEQEVRFEVIAHYNGAFRGEPEMHWTRTIEIVMVLVDGQWKFSQFDVGF